MRSFAAFISGAVAVLAALLAVPAMWVSTHVAQEDGYVASSSEVAKDPELQSALASYLADDFVQRGVLPDQLAGTAATVMTQVARATTNQQGFVEAWEQTQRGFHQSAFKDTTGPLTVDVSPLADFVTKRVTGLLPVTLTVPGDVVVPLAGDQDRERFREINRSTTYGLLALLVVVIGAAGAVMLARRRSVAVLWLGIGAVAVAGVLRLATSIAVPEVLDRVASTSEFARTVQKLLIDRASDSLSSWLLWIAIAGAAAAVGGLIGRGVSGLGASRRAGQDF